MLPDQPLRIGSGQTAFQHLGLIEDGLLSAQFQPEIRTWSDVSFSEGEEVALPAEIGVVSGHRLEAA